MKIVADYERIISSSAKWKLIKGEWTWEGLNRDKLHIRAIEYNPKLDKEELYKEHPYKTALEMCAVLCTAVHPLQCVYTSSGRCVVTCPNECLKP